VNVEGKATFGVAFNERGPAEGAIVVDTLRQIFWSVGWIIDQFESDPALTTR
jgi:hypothetical protein